ncbi:hypothetical protein PV326_008804 [Microctonus aethiopoides]|nr:hypothetical protein PV326_008804 [Microctonus aethiopoides]
MKLRSILGVGRRYVRTGTGRLWGNCSCCVAGCWNTPDSGWWKTASYSRVGGVVLTYLPKEERTGERCSLGIYASGSRSRVL